MAPMNQLSGAQEEWLRAHPEFECIGPPRMGVSFEESGTLYGNGHYVRNQQGQPIKMESGCVGVAVRAGRREELAKAARAKEPEPEPEKKPPAPDGDIAHRLMNAVAYFNVMVGESADAGLHVNIGQAPHERGLFQLAVTVERRIPIEPKKAEQQAAS